MTLVEMMVAMAIGSLVFLALGSLSIYSATSMRSMIDYTELNHSSRMALDQISREIRQSRGLASAPISNSTTMSLSFKADFGGVTVTNSISYDKTAKILTLSRTNELPVYLKDCTFFNWKFFDHSTTAGNFNFVSTTDYTQCKMIELNWLCSRDNWRKATNSESIQSMKVVIRKKPN